MTVLRSCLFNLLFYGTTAVLAVLGLPLLAGPRDWTCRLRDNWIRLALWQLRITVGLDYRVRGLERVPAGAVMIAAKHQSAWETLALHLIFADPAIVLKRELYRLPLFGFYLHKVGMIGIDRAGGARALRAMVDDAKSCAAAGRPILIFPEGTRTKPGETRDYHVGVFALYRALGLPVVPVALNSGLFWGRQSFFKRPGRIEVAVQPAIEPGLGRADFMARLQQRIETASTALLADAGARPNPDRQPD